jgi:hypothetical protein
MMELGRFSARPWALADDDKLRSLAITGASPRAIGVRMDRTETAVRSRARRLKIILGKSKFASRPPADGLRVKGK